MRYDDITGGRVENNDHTDITGVGNINLVTPMPVCTDDEVKIPAPSLCDDAAPKINEDDTTGGKKEYTDEGICEIQKRTKRCVTHGCEVKVKSFEVIAMKWQYLKYQPSGEGGTRSPPAKIKNGCQGGPKLLTGSGKVFTLRFFGVLSNFR